MYLETKHNSVVLWIFHSSRYNMSMYLSLILCTHFPSGMVWVLILFWQNFGQISFWHMIRQQILNDGRLKWIFIYRWMYRWCDDVCICKCYLFGVWIRFNYLFKILIVFIWIIYQQETSSKLGLLSELIVNKIVLPRDQKYIMYLLCRFYV